LDHKYDLFEEQFSFMYSDAAGVEACLQYLVDGSNSESLDIKFFNSIPNFLGNLDQFGVELEASREVFTLDHWKIDGPRHPNT